MSDQGDAVSNADDRWPPETSNTIMTSRGKSPATVHLRIACAFAADAIEQKLKEIWELLQKAGASEISIAVSVSADDRSPIQGLSARWMAPLSNDAGIGNDDVG